MRSSSLVVVGVSVGVGVGGDMMVGVYEWTIWIGSLYRKKEYKRRLKCLDL